MSRTLILTSFPPGWERLGDLTIATHRKYAAAHGYDQFTDVSNMMMTARTPYTDVVKTGFVPVRYFIKFALLEHFLDAEACGKDYDTVAWFDSDVLFTRFDRPLAEFAGEIVTAYDVNGVHPTVIIVRKSPQTRAFVWACNDTGRRLFQNHDWSDNMCLRFFSESPPYDCLMQYYSAKELCAMHPGLYTTIPADIRKMYEWDETSLALHLSALGLEDRVRLATEYIERLGLLP